MWPLQDEGRRISSFTGVALTTTELCLQFWTLAKYPRSVGFGEQIKLHPLSRHSIGLVSLF